MSKIVYTGDPILLQRSEEVKDAAVPKTRAIIKAMKAALTREKFGVAIAAPQIGKSVRMFVIAGKVFAHLAEDGKKNGDEEKDKKKHPDQVFINPKVLRISRKKQISNEGCLSIPGKYGTKVKRAQKVTILYMDENGDKHELGATGFLAQVFQHEIDHLDGILYTDHALEVIDVDKSMKPIDSDYDLKGARARRLKN